MVGLPLGFGPCNEQRLTVVAVSPCHLSISSEDDGTRTRNHRIDSPIVSLPILQTDNTLQQTSADACRPACCPDLDFVISHWSGLAGPIQAGILAMVRSAVETTDGTS